MGRTNLRTVSSTSSLLIAPGQITHLQLDSGTSTLKTLWIQAEGVVFLYAKRYVGRPSILHLDTLLVDNGGILHLVPGDPDGEPLILRLGKSSSLVLVPPPSDLVLLVEIMEIEAVAYRKSRQFVSDSTVRISLIARTLLTDSIRIEIYGS
jgi:hypothetical protein